MKTIEAITPTVCQLMNAQPPALSQSPALGTFIKAARDKLGSGPIEKSLIYCPDAMGMHIYGAYPAAFSPVLEHAPVCEMLHAVDPPVTPVCFASMFTGAPPEKHGIRRYERPVLQCDTIFDALVRAGKRVAIVAVRNSSIDIIFRGRQLDYFSEEYDPQVIERARSLLMENRHDVIVVYCQEYDDAMHQTTPLSETAVRAMHDQVAGFADVGLAVRANWSSFNHAILFCPDHGAHVDPATGRGTHGLNIPEDMEVLHFFGCAAAIVDSAEQKL